MVVGPGYHDYGIRAINGLIHDETGDYIDNPMFPRKAICDFEVKYQWCCEEIFHTPTLTIGKKILPPFYPDPGLALNLSA